MTTFTMQDLTPEQQVAVNNHEEMHKMFNDMGSALTQPTEPTIPDPIGTPVPNPTPDLSTIIDTICTQLQLLATVIKGGVGTNTTPPEGAQSQDQSLQDCVALTLQQADWFKDMVRRELIGGGIEDLAKDAVEEVVENEVEHYFQHRFDPTDHFDFGDAVQDAVSDQIDDVVADKIDDVVAEKLSEARIKIEF